MVFWAAFPCLVGGAGKAADKETDQLRGVWKQPVPKGKGRGGHSTLVFDKDRLLWVRTHTLDGEPLSGVSLPYTYRLDPKASPKAMTLTRWDLKDLPAREALYEVKGDTLRLCVGIGGKRPKGFDDKEGQVLVFARDRKAKAPRLAWEKEAEVRIKPRKQWLGEIKDRKVEAECPRGPITRQEDLARVWKAVRGKEEPPAVDFAREFVMVQTDSFSWIDEVGLIYHRGRVSRWTAIRSYSDKRPEGFTYGIGVFTRERVDVVEGRLVFRK
jgi:uncharacterized protein (TIGR03067 family)